MSKYKSWSLTEIKEVFKEISQKMEMNCLEVPIKISGRMTRTQGQYTCKTKDLAPVKFTFAKILLDGSYNYETVKAVIVHEYCHFYANSKYQAPCGHDARFKASCRKAGISDNTYFQIIKDVEVPEIKIETPKIEEVKVIEIIKETTPIIAVIKPEAVTPEMIQQQAKLDLLILKGKTNKVIIELSLLAFGINYKYNGENLKTYGQWKSAGYQVQKGQKALLGCKLWTPCHFSQSACEDKDNNKNDKKEYTKLYLKKSSLFSLEQVKLI